MIKNNLKAIAIHIGICLICFILLVPFFDEYDGEWGHIPLLACSLAIVIMSIVFYLYFWLGRKFLCYTESKWKNIISVIAIPIILMTFIFLTNIEYTRPPCEYANDPNVICECQAGFYVPFWISLPEYFLTMPFYPITTMQMYEWSYVLDVFFPSLVLYMFPSLFIWWGMMSQKKREEALK